MHGWRITSCAGTLGLALALAACGGSGPRQDASEPNAQFSVKVAEASFPNLQRLSQHSHLVIAVQNTGTRTIPDIAVTITDPPYGTGAQSFGRLLSAPAAGQPILAGRSRAVWIVDQAPGPCQYSCLQGGPGGAVTADADTWALGRLAPGQTARFDWAVTAVQPGTYTVRYQVAAGLAGKAKAVGGNNRPVIGSFHVKISQKPRQAYVNDAGQVVNTG